MNRGDLQDWLDRYVAAWGTNDRAAIEALFTPDAEYRWRPYGAHRILRGREAILDWWLEEPDTPGTWEARYEAWAADGDRGVAVGTSRYLAGGSQAGQTYHNVFRVEFAPDGRCRTFVEHWMLEEPDEPPPAG